MSFYPLTSLQPTPRREPKSFRSLMSRSTGPTLDLYHRWTAPRVTPQESVRLERQNLISLDRKITYCLNRPSEPFQ